MLAFMEKIKVGVIGLGYAWERLHHPAFEELADRYQITAICDINRGRAEYWGQRLGLDINRDVYTNYLTMVERRDLQVIDIMVPIAQNHPVAEAIAGSGKAIILEKPMGASVEQAEATRGLPERYGIQMMIAENYRYSEEFNLIRDMVRLRKVGTPVHFSYHRTSCFPCAMKKDTFSATEWRQHPDYSGGDLLDAAIHDLAGLRHVFGAVEYLQALGVPQKDDFSPYAAVTVNLQFMNKVIGNFTYYPAGQEPQKPLVGLRIFCTQGMIYLEEPQCGIINVFYNDGRHEMVTYRPMRGYYNELVNFHNALLGREALAVTPEMEIGDLRTVFAILQSITEQDVVKVDRVPYFAVQG
ncbi:putative dehydrogenase [Hydrogenispora ethanolica]|uniref:Putative dehydrogenase n=2 Tax=Hydrogenispora ethanolica TaxID=1082276 RepID=A0A4R1QN76_HYDET|nr:putative dehydrogenase [Hydrogenispora ethanolica]